MAPKNTISERHHSPIFQKGVEGLNYKVSLFVGNHTITSSASIEMGVQTTSQKGLYLL